MIDTSFIRQTDKDANKQIKDYEKAYTEYYNIKPKKRKHLMKYILQKNKIKRNLE